MGLPGNDTPSWAMAALAVAMLSCAAQAAVSPLAQTYCIQCPPPPGVTQNASLCVDGTPSALPDPALVGTTIAFFGDAGMGPNAVAVLNLVLDEGADAIVHLGDLGYEQGNYIEWMAQYDEILGPSFPVFAAPGNHELSNWDLRTAKVAIHSRLNAAGTCRGVVADHVVCSFRGIVFSLTAAGLIGYGHADHTAEHFDAFPAQWRICAWHHNVRLMQTGHKGDTASYLSYDTCRAYGAAVATGHEHSYSRTHELSSFVDQAVSELDAATVRLNDGGDGSGDAGTSFTFVSGLGGKSIRPVFNDADSYPWMAASVSSNSSANYGAVICEWTAADSADCMFKQIDGVVRDTWTLTTLLPPATVAEANSTDRSVQTVTMQARLGHVFLVEPDSFRTCHVYDADDEASAAITVENDHSVVMIIPNVPLTSEAAITRAVVELTVHDGSEAGVTLEVTVAGLPDHAADDDLDETCHNLRAENLAFGSPVTWHLDPLPPATFYRQRVASPSLSTALGAAIGDDFEAGAGLAVRLRLVTGGPLSIYGPAGCCASPRLRVDVNAHFEASVAPLEDWVCVERVEDEEVEEIDSVWKVLGLVFAGVLVVVACVGIGVVIHKRSGTKDGAHKPSFAKMGSSSSSDFNFPSHLHSHSHSHRGKRRADPSSSSCDDADAADSDKNDVVASAQSSS